jgi:hypothetical protein
MLLAFTIPVLSVILGALSIILIGPAAFGLTYMVSYLPGPFNIFHWIMELAGIIPYPVYNDDGVVLEYVYDITTPDRFITKLFSCPHCLGTWVALLMSVAFVILVGVSLLLIPFIWLGSYGILGYMMERVTNGESH